MFWFFDRENEALRLETRYDNDRSEFVAVVTYPDGRERTERFSNLDDFGKWIDAFNWHLLEQHWTDRKGSIVLPYGWPNKRLM